MLNKQARKFKVRILADFWPKMNSGLGNRALIKGYKQHKLCQVCQKLGQKNKLHETHLLFECMPLKPAHIKYDTQNYKLKHVGKGPESLYKTYWLD